MIIRDMIENIIITGMRMIMIIRDMIENIIIIIREDVIGKIGKLSKYGILRWDVILTRELE